MHVNIEKIERVAKRLLPWAFALFVAVTILLIVVHEPWSDEAQAWLLARDASLHDLFFVYAGYEGSPVLWHLILMPFAKLGFPYVTMHIIHACFTVGMAWIFVRKAPFASLHKILFLFGYFPLFEYNAIARSYVLSAFFLFWMAAAFKSRAQHPFRYAVPLALLMQTNVHSFLLGLPLVLIAVYDFFHHKTGVNRVVGITSLALLVLSIGVSVRCLISPSDLALQLRGWNFFLVPEKFVWLIGVFVHAYTPLPIIGPFYWDGINSFLLNGPMIIVGLCSLVALPIIFFGECRRAALTYVAGALLLCGVFFLKSPPYMRQIGLLFFFFLSLVWMHWDQLVQNKHRWLHIARYSILCIILWFHFVAAIPVVLEDIFTNFSASTPAAESIERQQFTQDNAILVGYPSFNAASMLPLLAQRFTTVYALELERPISFSVWRSELFIQPLTEAQITERLERIANQYPDKQIVYVNGGKSPVAKFPDSYRSLESYSATAVRQDQLSLYLYSPAQAR